MNSSCDEYCQWWGTQMRALGLFEIFAHDIRAWYLQLSLHRHWQGHTLRLSSVLP